MRLYAVCAEVLAWIMILLGMFIIALGLVGCGGNKKVAQDRSRLQTTRSCITLVAGPSVKHICSDSVAECELDRIRFLTHGHRAGVDRVSVCHSVLAVPVR